jgi:integrase
MQAWSGTLSAWRREMRAGGLRDGTIRLRTAHLRQFAERHPGGPKRVTRAALIAWLALPRSPEYRRSVRSSLVVYFAWAQDVGEVQLSPARRLPRVRVPRRRPRPADDDVILAALAVAPVRTLLMLRLMAELGLRRAEASCVDSRDVELTGLRVYGKGGVERIVPLPRDLRRLLSSLPPGPVFPGRVDGHLSPGHVGRLVSDALPAGVVPHQLRHSAATAWRRLGLPLDVIRDLLGHASVRTTEIYVLVEPDGAREVIETAAARLHPHLRSRRAVG